MNVARVLSEEELASAMELYEVAHFDGDTEELCGLEFAQPIAKAVDTIPNLITTIRDRDRQIDELRDLARNMYESLEKIWRFVAKNCDTGASFDVLPDAVAATERYERQVLGEDVGCVPRIEDEVKALRKVAEAASATVREVTDVPRKMYELKQALDELEALG